MGHGLAPLVRDDASQENLEWIDIRPTNAVIVRDAHDGIGVIDVGPDPDSPASHGLLEPNRIDALVNQIYANSDGEFTAVAEWEMRGPRHGNPRTPGQFCTRLGVGCRHLVLVRGWGIKSQRAAGHETVDAGLRIMPAERDSWKA